MGIIDWDQLAIFDDLVVDATRIGNGEEDDYAVKQYSLHLNTIVHCIVRHSKGLG